VNTYDYVVVLCASGLNQQGAFDEIDQHGLYLGGQVRMRAAIELYNNPLIRTGKFILIGGGVEEQGKEKWRKVVGMRSFLENNAVPRSNIVCIASGSDTPGNFRALWKVYGSEIEQSRVGILTNFYHLARSMRIAQDAQFAWDAHFIPICAESIIMAGIPFSLSHIPELTTRIAQEIKGLSDWEKGEYEGQHEHASEWKGELLN